MRISRGIILAAVLMLGASGAAAEPIMPNLDRWPLMTPRAMSMGGAFAAMSGDSSVMFYNPAALINRDNKTYFSYSRSIRHVPTGRKPGFYFGHKGGNLPDQLDCDLVSFSIPTGRNGAVGLGFSLPKEWGYDYQNEHAEKLFGDFGRGHGTHFSVAGRLLPFDSDRRHAEDDWAAGLRFSRTTIDMVSPSGRRTVDIGSGAAVQIGLYVELESDLFLGLSLGLQGEDFFKALAGAFGGRDGTGVDTVRTGLAYRPSPYTAAALDLEWRVVNPGGEGARKRDLQVMMGIERWFWRTVAARIGLRDGNGTYGVGGKIGSAIIDFAVIKNFLPDLLNKDMDSFKDSHLIGVRGSF